MGKYFWIMMIRHLKRIFKMTIVLGNLLMLFVELWFTKLLLQFIFTLCGSENHHRWSQQQHVLKFYLWVITLWLVVKIPDISASTVEAETSGIVTTNHGLVFSKKPHFVTHVGTIPSLLLISIWKHMHNMIDHIPTDHLLTIVRISADYISCNSKLWFQILQHLNTNHWQNI